MARLAIQHFRQAGRRGLGRGNDQVVRIHFQKGTNHKNLTRIIWITISGSAKSAISMKTDFLEKNNVFCSAEYAIFFDKTTWITDIFCKNNMDPNSPKHNNYDFSKWFQCVRCIA